MRYLEKTKVQTAAHGPYNRGDVRLWFQKYGLDDPYTVVNEFRRKYCQGGFSDICGRCPFQGEHDDTRAGVSCCGLIVYSNSITDFKEERVDDDKKEDLAKLVKGLNDLRNRCSNYASVGSCRECALNGYAGLKLCGGRKRS